MKIGNVAGLVGAKITLAIAPKLSPTCVRQYNRARWDPAGTLLRLASNIDHDAGTNCPSKRNPLGRPFAFGEMKRCIHMGPDMLRATVVIRGIPISSGSSALGDLFEVERFGGRPMMRVFAERIR